MSDMRRKSWWVLSAIGATLLAAPVQARAQDSTGSSNPAPATGHRVGGGGMGGARGTERLFQGIALTDAERDSINKLTAAHDKMVDDRQRQTWRMHQGGMPPDSAAQAQMQAQRAQYMATLRAVLTPDQQPTFDKNLADMQSEMRSRMQRMGGAGGPPPGGP
jgi:Spy/CpxP family protein refolding chaperone